MSRSVFLAARFCSFSQIKCHTLNVFSLCSLSLSRSHSILCMMWVRADAPIYQNMSNKIYNHRTPILIAYTRNLRNVRAVCESANRLQKKPSNRFKNAHALAFTLVAWIPDHFHLVPHFKCDAFTPENFGNPSLEGK